MEPMCVAREGGNDILSYVDFSKIWDVIKYFNELKNILEKKILLSLSYQFQDRLNDEMNILNSYNHMRIKLIQACTFISQSTKYISRIPSFLQW